MYNPSITIVLREVLDMRAVLTVIGKDRVGILAKVSNKCAECNANIIEVTQTVLQDLFCMIARRRFPIDASNLT